MDRMLVGICCPAYGPMPLEFVNCLLQLQRFLINNNIPHFFNIQTGSFLPHTRAKCLGASLDRGKYQIPFNNDQITHLVLLDTDVIFKPSHIFDLIAHDKEFVAAMCPYSTSAYAKENDKQIIAGMWNEAAFKKHKYFPPLTISEARNLAGINGLVKIDWVGLGLAVINPKVFSAIEYPWFASELIDIAEYTDTTSEDVGFCRKIIKAGFNIYIDTKVRVQHYKSFAI